MEKVAGVVVTFNRKELLRKNILSLIRQTRKLDAIYIIDNDSTDGTFEYIKDLIENNKEIMYIKLEENEGGAGGFYNAIKSAYEDGYDYIWGMDDDAYPEKDALEKLIIANSEIKGTKCLWSNCINAKENGYIEYKWWMFVGFFIPREVIEDVGFPRKDFFIYHDDTEYIKRILKKGYKLYLVTESKIVHKENLKKEFYSKKVFGKNLKTPKISDWRLYYSIRNSILKYNWCELQKYKQIFIKIPKEIIRVIILNPKQLKIIIKAYIHGIFGISGKKISP